jgi:integration host factor subunit alpha
MTKIDIIDSLQGNLGLTKKEAREVVEVVFYKIKQTLIDGEGIKLSGFGTFNVRKKRARKGRNPMTKEEFDITPRKVVTFKASVELKKSCNKK